MQIWICIKYKHVNMQLCTKYENMNIHYELDEIMWLHILVFYIHCYLLGYWITHIFVACVWHLWSTIILSVSLSDVFSNRWYRVKLSIVFYQVLKLFIFYIYFDNGFLRQKSIVSKFSDWFDELRFYNDSRYFFEDFDTSILWKCRIW